MKTQIISRICGCVLSILFANGSFAQANFEALSPVAISGARLKVSEKIETEFRKLFANAENAKWYYLDKKFVVKFSMDDQDHQALLNKRGALIYDISYGFEKNLPPEIRKLIKINYFDYNITRAIKVSEGNRLIWIVNMEDDKSIVIARVENGAMEEVNNFRKSL